jgi:Peptidase M15
MPGARPLVRSLAIVLALSLAQPAFAGDARPSARAELIVTDTLRGRSGKLMARFLPYLAQLDIPILSAMLGDSVTRTPGVHVLRDSSESPLFTFITLRPFSDKVQGRVGGYRMGYWPFERRRVRSDAYAGLDGFIEVTPENQDTWVSEHFRLRDFLTKDQRDVWPKYLVLDTKLVDKLELVIEDLVSRGFDVRHLSVMSGFRTPQYNRKGVGRGRADASRHQYGDAADVFVDNDRNGRMDDVNRDGRVDTRDARIVLGAVDRVEAQYPGLVGGAGVYAATRGHGPFTHIDARGTRARWGRI